ncbi:MAG TPA: hypothetical protein DC048_02260, partial [Planctomycetaceae bacterium]|nr:hypothetical protein [Planctomycetaceae bacterium]
AASAGGIVRDVTSRRAFLQRATVAGACIEPSSVVSTTPPSWVSGSWQEPQARVSRGAMSPRKRSACGSAVGTAIAASGTDASVAAGPVTSAACDAVAIAVSHAVRMATRFMPRPAEVNECPDPHTLNVA